MSDSVECVQVVVRCRPLNEKEINKGCKKILSVDEESGEILVGNNDKKLSSPKNDKKTSFFGSPRSAKSGQYPSKMFTFDKAYGEKLRYHWSKIHTKISIQNTYQALPRNRFTKIRQRE